MSKNCSHAEVVDLVARMEDILETLDSRDDKLAAIKLDEAISALCDAHDICRAPQNILKISSH